MRFGEYLVAALDKADLNQSAFAAKVGQKQQALNAIIRGKRPPPLKHMDKWVSVLGKIVDKDTFIELAELEHCPERIRQLVLNMRKKNPIKRRKPK